MRRWIAPALLGAALAAGGLPALAQTFTGRLSGDQEAPPNASPGSGTVTVTLDTVQHELRIDASFADLVAPTVAAHLHCCTLPGNPAGIAVGQPDLPTGVTSGSVQSVLQTDSAATYSAAFLDSHGGTALGAEAALLAGLMGGRVYYNVHTTVYPGGELRANLAPIPEPSTYALLGAGLLLLGATRGRRRRA